MQKQKKTLAISCAEESVFILVYVLLGAFSAAVMNFSCIIAYLACYKDKMNSLFKIVWLAIFIPIAHYFNEMGWIGWLPIIAAATFTIFMTVENEGKFKILLAVIMTMWAIHDFYVKDFVSGIADVISVVVAIGSGFVFHKDDMIAKNSAKRGALNE